MSALRVPARLFGAHRAPASRASRPRGAVSRIPRRALPSESAAEPTDSPDAAAETDDAWRGVCDAVTIFWDLDNLRPPNGLETVWAFRMVEAAFEFADVAHVRAYARAGTVGDDARTVLDAVGVTLVECPAVPEGSDAVLSTDVVNFVRGGGRLASDDSRPDILANEAARAVRESRTHGVMIATRDEGMAECVRFARASEDCVVAIVAGEFVSKAAHRPQFTRPMTADGDVGVTPGYWRVLQNVAGKGPRGPMGKSKLASEADLTLLWDSRRLFDLPAAGSGLDDADGDDEGVRDPESSLEDEEEGKGEWPGKEGEEGEEEGDGAWAVGGEVQESGALAVRGGFAAAWTRDGRLERWPPVWSERCGYWQGCSVDLDD